MERFTLHTDHEALKWMFDNKSKGAKLDRWRLRLQKFDFYVSHLPGKKNQVADALSRLQTTTGDQRKGLIDVEIPVLSSEPVFSFSEDINPSSDDAADIGMDATGSLSNDSPPPEPIPVLSLIHI